MFDKIVNPRSLTKMSPAEKRRHRVGLVTVMLVYSLAVLVQIDHFSFLAVRHVKFVVIALETVGLVLLFWVLAAKYFDWGTTERKH